jgi:hypothetical protein
VKRADLAGMACVLLSVAALEAFRLIWFEPRSVGLACLHGTAPAGLCVTRSAMAWLIHFGVLGAVSMCAGILALAGAPFPVAVIAVCFGAAGLIEYNVSWGMLGLALGGWVWATASVPRCLPIATGD